MRVRTLLRYILPLGLLAFSGTLLQAAPVIQIASGSEPPLSTADQTGFGDRIVIEAFRRIGRDAEIIQLPARRALLEANNGIVDGDLLRVKEVPQRFPNLLRVPEKIFDQDFSAFTHHVQITANGWDSLKPYNIGFITGWVIVENNLGDSRKLTRGVDTRHVMRLLANDRVDVAVASRWMGLQAIHDLGLSDVRLLEPPLETRAMFLMLHKRHADLLPDLAEALRKMKQDGTFQRLHNETLKPLLTPPMGPAH